MHEYSLTSTQHAGHLCNTDTNNAPTTACVMTVAADAVEVLMLLQAQHAAEVDKQ